MTDRNSHVAEPFRSILNAHFDAAAPSAKLVAEFIGCLRTLSHSRAGWDFYDMPKEQRAKEDQEAKCALARVRQIWAQNDWCRDALRDAFRAEKPLATLQEIESP